MTRNIMLWLVSLGLYLGLHGGYLALWNSDKTEPEKVFPYHISLYPEIDKELLEKGIPIHSKSELSERIEDYVS